MLCSHHFDLLTANSPSFLAGYESTPYVRAPLNAVLTAFVDKMKAQQNAWQDVTLVLTSDFARTLTADSGGGSDHAWYVLTI